ncbi:MAG: hypothetical protein HYX64_10040 [Gammaproteobacteria bacterium]|nr:hypothetical protein [Gammaproteobacteria bacterium]
MNPTIGNAARLDDMPARFSSRPWLLTLICAALLLARLGGAHLHLSFDGVEPPTRLHTEVDTGHHTEHHDGVHEDLDISLIGEALAKPGKLLLDLPVLLFAAFWLSLLITASRPILAAGPPRLSPSSTSSLRPPLRGPPPIAS